MEIKPDTPEHTVRLGKSMNFKQAKTSMQLAADLSFKDEFTLTLIAGEEEVGKVTYDFSQLVDQPRTGFKAVLNNEPLKSSKELRMTRTSDKYPKAMVEFHIKVEKCADNLDFGR